MVLCGLVGCVGGGVILGVLFFVGLLGVCLGVLLVLYGFVDW